MREPKDLVVLVVDDEEALRKAIVFDFKRKGFQTLEAENGRDAFELAKKHQVDIILSDVRMPGGDGLELLRSVKGENPNLPVVMFITGFADMSMDDAYNNGADAVFSKPFDRKMLLSAVLKALASKDEAWTRKSERIESSFHISLSIPGLDCTVEGKVLNIGRGGIFVAIQESFPEVGTEVTFRIQIEQGAVQEIEGAGIVRWIRTQASGSWPSGCGIEFSDLSDFCRHQVIEYINRMKTVPFIPKS